ncbi:Abi-alpha family protein [Limosilactobacillus fermentum]|uniref:Abi-alpha family protein n=1 Tax=Limosilactobacillus fermentum TaxID=1613 RepID=UPI003FA58ABD
MEIQGIPLIVIPYRYGVLTVSQFGPSEAKFLKTIYQQSGQQLPYGQLRLDLGNSYGYTFPTKIAIDDNSNIVNNFNSSLDILVSLGVVNDNQSNKLAKSDDKYSTIEKIIRITINKPIEYESNELNLVHSYISLTDFGHGLCKCIFE